MAKPRKRYVCQLCGSLSPRWAGQCADCGEWNSLVEDAEGVVTPFSARHNLRTGGRRVDLVGLDAEVVLPERVRTGIAEFDRALGGGMVAGSATLIGGDPGIGKSTLLLQAAAKIAAQGLPVAYISGEEAADQVRLRARPARARRGAAAARRGDLGARYFDDARRAGAARFGRDRFDPDHVFGPDRRRAGNGESGPRRRPRTDPFRQGERRGDRFGRPCHQGRRDRGAARARTYGRYRAVVRRRAQPPVSDPAATKNRYGGTDEIGVFADGRRRAGRSLQPLRPLPHRPRRGGARRGRLPRRSRGPGRCWSRSRR